MISDNRKQYGIAALLALLIVATHGYHFATALHLPPATWAVFFAAGFYVRRAWLFVALVAEVVVLDYLAVNVGGVNAFCVSPAYGFLLPAYASLWLTGRWYAKKYSFSIATLPMLGVSILGSAILAETFTGGGFYFFSGRFADTSLAEFGTRFVQYFPQTLQSFAFWMAIGIVVHIAFTLTQSGERQST